MPEHGTSLNLVLSWGGIKGIAYIGMLDILEKRGFSIANIAGVSAGALVGSLIGAGYKSDELLTIMSEFDFKGIEINNIEKKVPVVEEYLRYTRKNRIKPPDSIFNFLNMEYINQRNKEGSLISDISEYRGSLLKSIINYSKQGFLLDGDYLEEWLAQALRRKGIRTFADLRGGAVDKQNPNGYKVRMTAVDATRNTIIKIPDDLTYYGYIPDNVEVAMAVRMSTCVPFAFKPVELRAKEGDPAKVYNIIDGGVLDNFPYWLLDCSSYKYTAGFRLGSGKKKLFSLTTPLVVYKMIVSIIRDLGIPKNTCKLKNISIINTGKISFLDFKLSEKDRMFLYRSGRNSAEKFMNLYQAKL